VVDTRLPRKPTNWWPIFAVLFVALLMLVLLFFIGTTPLHGP